MGQKRVSEVWVTNTEAAEHLDIHPSNVKKTLTNGLRPVTLTVEAREDADGVVRAMQVPYGGRPTWVYRRELMDNVLERRAERARA